MSTHGIQTDHNGTRRPKDTKAVVHTKSWNQIKRNVNFPHQSDKMNDDPDDPNVTTRRTSDEQVCDRSHAEQLTERHVALPL